MGMYALALDGEKLQCQVRTSNAGQVLMSGIASPERARIVADGLIRPQFMSGWGIRTVAVGEARYNPMSYHNGSIWPHDNALIAMGFAHYGFKAEVDLVFQGLVGAASRMELRRLPELFWKIRRARPMWYFPARLRSLPRSAEGERRCNDTGPGKGRRHRTARKQACKKWTLAS
jgi:glycogen debranching enzyme